MIFDDEFRRRFFALVQWRRDVRRFRTTPLPGGLLEELIGISCLAPSVGLSEPWRFVRVKTVERRERIRQEFERANSDALAGYTGEQADLYTRLKLEGLDCAPEHLAVFADVTTKQGSGLGRNTMPEMLEYSVVGAIATFWLAARARNIGVGWVSILQPVRVHEILEIPPEWRLIAYLCVGYPEHEDDVPELEREGWEHRVSIRSTPLLER